MAPPYNRPTVLFCLVVVVFVTASAGGQLTSSISDALAVSSHCGSYCDLSGQLVPGQQCGPSEVCCGSLRSRHCCSTSSLEALIIGLTNSALSEDFKCPEVDKDDEDNEDQGRNPRAYSSTTKSTTDFSSVIQWWWFIVPLLTIACLIILLSMCYCIRHKGSQVDTTNERRPGSTPSRGNSRRPSMRDFDPTNECAFAPPAYDTLLKNPPTYEEIYPSVQSCWIYDVDEDSPPVSASRRSSLLPPRYEDHHLDRQHTTVTMTPEPPYTEVIY